MKTESVATVICLSPELERCVEAAVGLLGLHDPEGGFRFVFGGVSEALRKSDRRAPHSWDTLEQVLAGERGRRKCEHLIGVLDEPIENNWFSRTAYGKNVAWITTNDWEFYSDVPAPAFVAYEVLCNLILMLVAKRPEDEEWLMREVIHTEETRECISDMCAYKPDITRGIRSGGVCEDCQRVLRERLGEARVEEILGLLSVVRRAARAEVPRASVDSFPALRESWKRARGLMDSRRQELRREQRQLEEELAEPEFDEERGEGRRIPLQLLPEDSAPSEVSVTPIPPAPAPPAQKAPDVPPKPMPGPKAKGAKRRVMREGVCGAPPEKPRKEDLARSVHQLFKSERRELHAYYAPPQMALSASADFMVDGGFGEMLEAGLPGMHHEIERGYPFPIAYCFRAMRAELNPTDRWLRLYDLYKLIVRYVTFVLLADRADRRIACPGDLGLLVENLKYCSDGKWGKTCIGMMRLCREKLGGDSAVFGFLDSLGAAEVADTEAFSKAIVKDRDFKQGHGYVEEAAQYQAVFERHLPGMKRLLARLGPLAKCALIRPVQVLHNCGGECVFVSKVLVGADTIFVPYKMHGTSAPETVCQLMSADGERRLSLYPWLHLERCETCQREMVFLFHEVAGFDDRAVAKLREYPSNHEKARPDLTRKVRQCLTPG